MDNTLLGTGFALVNDSNLAFGWYASLADAQVEAAFQRDVYGSRLRLVKDIEATWPAWTAHGTYAG